MSLRRRLRRLVRRAGYDLVALPANRFEAQEDGLRGIRARGFVPHIVVDGGANVGVWTAMARPIFPDAAFHLVEPQPVCAPALDGIAGVTVHHVALTRPGITTVRMADAVGLGGAWVADGHPEEASALAVPATTLDALFGGLVTRTARALIKLDLEGHELTALEGATAVLGAAEVVVIEVTFFDFDRRGFATFTNFVTFMRDRGFLLYDVLSLHSRRRDGRLRTGDVMFVRGDSSLVSDAGWE